MSVDRKRVHIVNASRKEFFSNGTLCTTLCKIAKDEASRYGWEVTECRIDDGYDPKAEVEKIRKADLVVFAFPGWWMGMPYTSKQYIDTVLTTGAGVLWKDDGRTRSDIDKPYGSGGEMTKNQKVFVTSTWNMPASVVDDPRQFMAGQGVFGINRCAWQPFDFCGMDVLPPFSLHDVVKVPEDIPRQLEEYKQHFIKRVLTHHAFKAPAPSGMKMCCA